LPIPKQGKKKTDSSLLFDPDSSPQEPSCFVGGQGHPHDKLLLFVLHNTNIFSPPLLSLALAFSVNKKTTIPTLNVNPPS
jgi:hypothetical protein